MKQFKVVCVLLLTFVLGFALVGCQQQSSSDTKSDVDQMQDAVNDSSPFYVLVVGNDSRQGTVEINKNDYKDGKGRSDTMMLARIDPANYKITLITVPRDTDTTVNGKPHQKLNDAYYEGGISALTDQVEQLTGVDVKYSLDMGFVQFENFINGLGVVSADVPIKMSLQDIVSGDNITLNEGTQDLNGAQALVLARVRKAYADDLDACRQIQDRQIVQNAIMQVAKKPAVVEDSVNKLMDNVQTDWPKEDLAGMVVDFAEHANQIDIISGTGPYQGGINDSNQLWLATRDEGTWKKVIDVVNQGGDPTTVVPLPEVKAAA